MIHAELQDGLGILDVELCKWGRGCMECSALGNIRAVAQSHMTFVGGACGEWGCIDSKGG